MHAGDTHGVNLPVRLPAPRIARPREHTEELRESELFAADGRRLAQRPLRVTRGCSARPPDESWEGRRNEEISDIKVEAATGSLVLAQPRDVDELEARLWITFPAGYREYVTQLGEGVLGGTFVRVFPPWRVDKELAEWRHRINEFWFWDEGKDVLPKARALECAIIGDTLQGDDLLFHPRHTDRLFVLPREEGKVYVAGADLLSAVDWMCGSGKLTRRFKQTSNPSTAARSRPRRKTSSILRANRWTTSWSWGASGRADTAGEKYSSTICDTARVTSPRSSTRRSFSRAPGGVNPFEEQPGYLAVFRIDKANGEVRIINCQMGDN